VLGALLLVAEQLRGERLVLLARAAARAGCRRWAYGHLAPLHPDQYFGRAADQREVVEREVERYGAGLRARR